MQKITFVNESEPYLSAENLNQMQDNVENAINWKLYKSNVSASTSVDISTLDFNELYIEVRIGTTSAVSNNYITTFHILKNQLSSTKKYYRNGSYFTSAFNGGSVIEATNSVIKCVDNYFGGVVVNTHTRLDIYYK
jgi:hypothetical protein